MLPVQVEGCCIALAGLRHFFKKQRICGERSGQQAVLRCAALSSFRSTRSSNLPNCRSTVHPPLRPQPPRPPPHPLPPTAFLHASLPLPLPAPPAAEEHARAEVVVDASGRQLRFCQQVSDRSIGFDPPASNL